MGKSRSWISAIKRVFTPQSSKEKLTNNQEEVKREEKNKKKKKSKGFGKLRNGDTNSFLPIFKEPSSIEKILCEAEREHNLLFRPPTTSSNQSKTTSAITRLASPRPSSPRSSSPKFDPSRVCSPKPPSPKPPSPRAVLISPKVVYRQESTITLLDQHVSATKIQACFRGYMARRGFRALKGLVRLQGVVRGQSVKRQTMNAMKYMQLLVRVQTQVQSRRIKMLENRSKIEKDEAKLVMSEIGNGDWDDSVLTKEEKEMRLHRKIDAMIKRERSMAYAYSHQPWKNSSMSSQDKRSSGFPLWWNWVDKQLPLRTPTRQNQSLKDFKLTPTRPSPNPSLQSQPQPTHATTPSRPIRTPQPHTNTSITPRYSREKGQESPFKDDHSLTSCPPFLTPSYMAPTVSAKGKVRASSNPKERLDRTTSVATNEKRKTMFPQSLGSFKWNKGSLFMSSNKNIGRSSELVVQEKHKRIESMGDLSIDSAVSMPVNIGRKRFNRFV